MSLKDADVAEGFRRYEVRTSNGGRHYIDQPKELAGVFPTEQNVTSLVRRFKRGEWVEDIHGWKLNPEHVIAVRLAR